MSGNGFYDLPFFPIGPNDGVNGKDGVSPTISVEDISNGHRLIIVDATGRKTVEVMDGAEGPQGVQGEQGPQGEKGDTGSKGDKGDKGDKGEPGKSAYEYAQDGGFEGEETVFAEKLAKAIDRNITIGIHTDGLLYLFIDNEPVGDGIVINTNTET